MAAGFKSIFLDMLKKRSEVIYKKGTQNRSAINPQKEIVYAIIYPFSTKQR